MSHLQLLSVASMLLVLGAACTAEFNLANHADWAGSCIADYSESELWFGSLTDNTDDIPANANTEFEGDWRFWTADGTVTEADGSEHIADYGFATCHERGKCQLQGRDVGTHYLYGDAVFGDSSISFEGWVQGHTMEGRCWPYYVGQWMDYGLFTIE